VATALSKPTAVRGVRPRRRPHPRHGRGRLDHLGRWIVVGSVVFVTALTALRALGARAVQAKTAERGI